MQTGCSTGDGIKSELTIYLPVKATLSWELAINSRKITGHLNSEQTAMFFGCTFSFAFSLLPIFVVSITPAEMNHDRIALHSRTQEDGWTTSLREGIERKDRRCLIVPQSARRQTESTPIVTDTLRDWLPFVLFCCSFFFFSLFLFCVFMLTRMKVCPLEGDSKLWMWISLEDVRESESRMKRHQQGVRICWTALAHVVHLSAWQSALCARSNQNKLSNPWPVHLSQRFHVSSANWIAA